MNPETYYNKQINPCPKCDGFEESHDEYGDCIYEEDIETVDTLMGRIRGLLMVYQWGWITEEEVMKRMDILHSRIEASYRQEGELAF